MTSPQTPGSLSNLEGRTDFDVTWPWSRGRLQPGLTAVLRVKNEARSLPWVLPPLFSATHHVVVVDNQSDDGTVEVADKVAAERDMSDRLTVMSYPFAVSRCGPEHLSTPARSVHSLSYYYNWAFSLVETTYSLKWDGDMVLTADGVATIRDLAWQMQSREAIARIPRHPLYVESERVAYLDLGLRNVEEYIYPNKPGYHFVKAFEWEQRMRPDDVDIVRLPQGLCVELKYLDSDEFAHWTGGDAFFDSARAERKQHEWRVFTALTQGDWHHIPRLQRIESPPGTHVIDYTLGVWLPRAKRPLVPPPRKRR